MYKSNFNVIGNMFGFTETFMHNQREHLIVSYGIIVDYKDYNDKLLEEVTIEQIIEPLNYVEGKEYKSVTRVFTSNFPAGIKTWINHLRKEKGLPPLYE